MSQALLWERADEGRAPVVLVQLALDVVEWIHQLGHDPVTLERWAAEFRPAGVFRQDERQWLKLRHRLADHGCPYDLADEDHPGQARRVLVALPPTALTWATEILDRGTHPDEPEEGPMPIAAPAASRTCEEPGCSRATLDRRPYCSEHMPDSPYAQGVANRIASYQLEAHLVVRGGMVRPDGLVAQEFLAAAASQEGSMVPIGRLSASTWLLDEAALLRVASALGLQVLPDERRRHAGSVLIHECRAKLAALRGGR